MRLWCEVYSHSDVLLGVIPTLISAEHSGRLDEAGSINIAVSAADETAFELLQSERKVRVFIEQDEYRRQLTSGVIRKLETNDSETGGRITATGPDSLDALARRSVLLGRIYEDQPIETIAADLVALVPGWTALVEPSLGNQTARFDGVSVLKALRRLVDEKGLHLRAGDAPNTVEIGAFGTDNGLLAIKPDTITEELYSQPNVMLIDKVKRVVNSTEVVNWIIPVGAGEGTAALTLRDSSHSIPTMTGPDGRTLFYLYDQDSIDLYDRTEAIKAFPDISPTANNAIAKERAADALYDAATAWLQRAAVPLTTYSLSLRKVQTQIKPGDLLSVKYKGLVETESGTLTFLDIDDIFWVMSITERVRETGVMADVEVSTIDRLPKGMLDTVLDVVERSEVRNVSVKPFPFGFQDGSERMIQAGVFPHYKEAVFGLRIGDRFTDITSVVLRVTSRPLISPTGISINFGGSQWWYYYGVYESTWYPQGVHLLVNGVDITTALGGPWNPNPSNSPIDVELDITDYILDAVGGLYQDHEIVFQALDSNSQNGEVLPAGLAISEDMSSGFIDCKILVQGSMKSN